jgi:uncharacterized delta-60 repeat protein
MPAPRISLTDRGAVLARADEVTLDPTFGTGGTVQTPFSLSGVSRISAQADGKILVAGFAFDPGPVAMVARYDLDGTLDPTFGGGFVTTTYEGAGGWAVRAVEQTDGKIVIAGLAYSVGGAFLNANTNDMLIDTDGNIVVLATSHANAGPPYVAAVLRFLSGGGLDSSFGTGGAVYLAHNLYTFGAGIT